MCKSGISPGIIKCLELHEHGKRVVFFLSDPLLSRGRLSDVWSSSFLHELIMNPYVWELLMKCFASHVSKFLWFLPYGVALPDALHLWWLIVPVQFLSQWGDSTVALSPSLLCQVLCQICMMELSLGCNLK